VGEGGYGIKIKFTGGVDSGLNDATKSSTEQEKIKKLIGFTGDSTILF